MPNVEFSLENANASVVQLLSADEASNELKTIDDYLTNLSRFDLDSRVQSSTATLDDYLAFVTEHVLSWNDEQIRCIESYVDFLNTSCIERLKLLTLPARIFVVLTDGRDENGAAYCRNKNVILLPEPYVKMTDRLRDVFIHELFHIWSRQDANTGVRDELYGSIGYHRIPVDREVAFPASLSDVRITNPDAPLTMKYFINLRKTADDDDETYKCTPILYASRSFDLTFSTNMFQYLVATTLVLDDDTYQPKEPLEYLSYDEAADFRDQIGENTGYIIHPEEILADNFVLWMIGTGDSNRLRTPSVVTKMGDIIACSSR